MWQLFACSFAAVILAKNSKRYGTARARHIRTLTIKKKKKKEPCFIVSVDRTSWDFYGVAPKV